MPPTAVNTLYRIVQEALTNIQKRTIATEAIIQMSTTSDSVSLSIEDNCKELNLKNRYNVAEFGLQELREWVASLSGNFQIGNKPGIEGRIMVELPLKGDYRTHLHQREAKG